MLDKTTRLRHSGIFVKTEHSSFYVPKKSSPEASICTDCKLPQSKCNGNCKRYKEEISKLKKTKKSSVSKNKKTKLVEKSIKNFMKDIRGKV